MSNYIFQSKVDVIDYPYKQALPIQTANFRCIFPADLVTDDQGPLLLTWFNFNPSMNK